ncbi:uncharacterized protein NEPG_00494 [Nematocida parisii ERTm1]|uniref:uncharacterized protein n=1 Tax=Nematocida parisii (strain ERTm1 / ATCC PRA-289) TaxID=881290 RepID=UPI000264B837|nr:uncharacterized protein NEPG_00494 [Nematocida parisii ERTm1]EIJ94969.1 hypothetical protein NEPG_00494 [Nematocida parisii ERTm1]|eukprot:XP_013058325.1 hypothetical protein NEPG_00494 [Nematocida parisii ERTm1]
MNENLPCLGMAWHNIKSSKVVFNMLCVYIVPSMSLYILILLSQHMVSLNISKKALDRMYYYIILLV